MYKTKENVHLLTCKLLATDNDLTDMPPNSLTRLASKFPDYLNNQVFLSLCAKLFGYYL